MDVKQVSRDLSAARHALGNVDTSKTDGDLIIALEYTLEALSAVVRELRTMQANQMPVNAISRMTGD